MLILLKPKIDFKSSKMYSFNQKNKEIVDKTFDKLYKQKKMIWLN